MEKKRSERSEVLIVDDERLMRESLGDILREEGYVVSMASTGEEAVAMCAERDFEAILMDVRMPGIDGVEAFSRIRQQGGRGGVILMSGIGEDQLRRRALEEGAVAFLAKPLDIDRTIKLIRSVKDTAILVVEDEAKVARHLAEELKKQGYRVISTPSPHKALDLVGQIRFDVIFIDAKLPVMNGLDLYLMIKKIVPSSVAIMIWGMEQEFESIAREAVRRTAYTIVHKPLDIEYILELLQTLTGQKASGVLQKPAIKEA